MSNLIERYEKERQMRLDRQIRYLQIKRLEKQMSEELDPFGRDFEEAARKLRELVNIQFAAALEEENYHRETRRLEEAT
ncbi:MAG: hypothetical protein J6J18_01865 [Oscillospiraceae bacterium]|nr:hypothetical protein [Oscillospiraceae bacterium]